MKRTKLARRTPIRRKAWRPALGDSEQRLAFKQAVCAGPCLMEGHTEIPCRGPKQAAHVVRKETLRKLGHGAEVVYDPRSAVCLCERHHSRHDNRAECLPLELMPEDRLAFVAEHDLSHVLERQYPLRPGEDAQIRLLLELPPGSSRSAQPLTAEQLRDGRALLEES